MGRTRPGPIVTSVLTSKHGSGLAVDLDIVHLDRVRGMDLWSYLGKWWKYYGGKWGGDWADYGHFTVY